MVQHCTCSWVGFLFIKKSYKTSCLLAFCCHPVLTMLKLRRWLFQLSWFKPERTYLQTYISRMKRSDDDELWIIPFHHMSYLILSANAVSAARMLWWCPNPITGLLHLSIRMSSWFKNQNLLNNSPMFRMFATCYKRANGLKGVPSHNMSTELQHLG